MSIAVFRPIRPQRTFEHAVSQIAEAIANGTLRPGDALPGERTLAAEMDVSRRTIREAMKVLAEAGVIRIVSGPGGGMFVQSEIVPADLTFHVETHISEISDVLEARRLIEPRVAQLAGVYAEREDFDELERITDLQLEQTGNRERSLALEARFHLKVARMSRNLVLYETMKNLIGRVVIAQDLATPFGAGGPEYPAGTEQRALAAVEMHRRTVEALRTRDADTIANVMNEHLLFLEDAWEAVGGRLRFRALPTILLDGGREPGRPRANQAR